MSKKFSPKEPNFCGSVASAPPAAPHARPKTMFRKEKEKKKDSMCTCNDSTDILMSSKLKVPRPPPGPPPAWLLPARHWTYPPSGLTTHRPPPAHGQFINDEDMDSFEAQVRIAAMNLPQYIHIQRNRLNNLKFWYRRYRYTKYKEDFGWEDDDLQRNVNT